MAATEKLTRDEIKRRYPDKWVVLVDFHEEGEDLIDGVVFDHGRDRDALCERMNQAPSLVAVEYTGEITGGLFRLFTSDVDREDQPRDGGLR
jgi:hypothetical protein